VHYSFAFKNSAMYTLVGCTVLCIRIILLLMNVFFVLVKNKLDLKIFQIKSRKIV